MTLRSFLRRNVDEIGEPIATYRNRPGPVFWIAAVFFWLLAPLSVIVNPNPSTAYNIAFPTVMGLLLLAIIVVISTEVLVVCERGLVVGSGAPLANPFVIPFEKIVRGSIVPVTNAGKLLPTMDHAYRTRAVRTRPWITEGVYFVGPDPEVSRRGRHFFPVRSNIRSVDGRWIWFVGTGKDRPEEASLRIADAAERSGMRRLARVTAAAEPREMTGNPADGPKLLPGVRST